MFYSLKVFICEKSLGYCVTSTLWNRLRIHKIPNRNVLSSIAQIRNVCQELSSMGGDEITAPSPGVGKATKRRRKVPSNQPRLQNRIASHLCQCNEELKIKAIPDKFISKTFANSDGFYVVGKNTASIIAQNVASDDVNIPVFEVNPGVGAVTKALLEKGVPEVHIFQLSFWQHTWFQDLNEEDSSKLRAYDYDFFTLWKRLLLDYYDDEGVKTLLSVVEPKPWSEGPPLKIFAAIPNKVLINHMIASIVFQKGFFQLGRLEFYFAFRPADYYYVTSNSSDNYSVYRATSVLFQILFEKTLLCKLPAKDFIPWMKPLPLKKLKFLPKLTEADADCMFLVKVTPRADLHEVVGGTDNLKALWHFVRQCFTLRSNRVIPTLEKWIPGCGPRLIFNNMTIYTEFGELSPAEMLQLFKMFSKWPEYPHCSFLDSMETYFLKSYIESNPDGVGEAEFEAADRGMEDDPECESVSDSRDTVESI